MVSRFDWRLSFSILLVLMLVGAFFFMSHNVFDGFYFDASGNLRGVRVAVVYERVTDGKFIGRSVDDVISIFREIGADFVFRGWWRWSPCPNQCEDLPSGRSRMMCELRGYSYRHLEDAVSKIKNELPGIIFCGAVPAQIIQRDTVWNPKTGEIFTYPETWDLALDPTKWGLNMSKREFQCLFGKTHLWVPEDLDCSEYDPELASAYFPDLTNPMFQELLLSWVERQVDAGVDAIWIDMLFKQASMMYRLTKDFSHPAVRESFEAACKIVDQIHEYGDKIGRYIYVGSWATPAFFPYSPPKLDFVTLSPSSMEVREMKFNVEDWNFRLNAIREKFGDIPVFSFIDWACSVESPLGQFSQKLSREKQSNFLRMADEFFSERNIIFIYPLHGGNMGFDAEILSFGVSKVYDSLAPEFQTYSTIVELAQRK